MLRIGRRLPILLALWDRNADPRRSIPGYRRRGLQQTTTGHHNEAAVSSYSHKLHSGECRVNFIMIGEQNKEYDTGFIFRLCREWVSDFAALPSAFTSLAPLQTASFFFQVTHLKYKLPTPAIMQPTLFTLFSLAATVIALPPSAGGFGNGNGAANQGNTDVRFSVPDDMTVKQAQAKCGDQAQLSCCNKALYAGDKSRRSGIELFDQCSKLDIQIPILIAVPIQDLVNQNCKQNVACCQHSASTAVSILISCLLDGLTNSVGLRFGWAWTPLHWYRLYRLISSLFIFSSWHGMEID